MPGLLDRSPKKNWVEKHGGLPRYIERIAVHLIEKGMTRSRAIATAINVAKKMCATGDLNFKGSQQVNPGSRAEACAAVAQWTALKAKARADNSIPAEKREAIDLAFRHIERDVLDMARAPGLVQAEIQVKNKSGKTFTRKIWVRPKQAKAMKREKGGGKLSEQGAKVTAEQTEVLNQLAKIPKADRPKGWQKLVKALVDPRHGGRLGPQKRKLLHDVAKKSPAGSPLRTAAANALKADVPKGRKKAKQKAAKRKRDAKKAGAIRGPGGKPLTQEQLVAAGNAQAAKKK